MNLTLKFLAYRICSSLGSAYIQKKMMSDLTIVMYHSVVEKLPPLYDWCYVDRESFIRQVRYLKKKFEVIPLSQVPEKLKSGNIERPLAVITFDDGYRNNFDVAFPVLKEEGLPAAIFLTTGLINTDDTLWVCRLHHALSATRETEINWDGKTFDISDFGKKAQLIAQIKKKFKKMSVAEILPQLREILDKLYYDISMPVEQDSPYRMLDYRSINEMKESGLIEFGAHSVSHEILSRLSVEDQEKEIKGSLNAVTEITGKKCTLFAYPNGSEDDYDYHTLELLKKYGVEVSVTTIENINYRYTPLLELGRYSIGNGMDMGHFELLVLNFIAWLRGFKSRNKITGYEK